MQNVYNKFTSPIVGDARSIAQIRADQKATMQENARLKNEAFQKDETFQENRCYSYMYVFDQPEPQM